MSVNNFEVLSTRIPKMFGKIINLLGDEGYMDNRSEVVRDAVDQKIRSICKTIMDSDELFEYEISGDVVVSYHLFEDQLRSIETLISLGFYTSKSEFIRDAVGDYINNLKILPTLLREKNKLSNGTVYKYEIIISGKKRTVVIEEDKTYFQK